MDIDKLAERLKYARVELRDLTLEDIAKASGVARSTVQRYETAKIQKVKIPVIESFARVLNVNPCWLSGYDVPMALEDTLSQSESATKKKELKEADLLEAIKDIYGSASALMFEMYLKLDEIDRAKVLERLETLLEADKYSTQDAYLNGKII